MDVTFRAARSGLEAQQRALDVAADNLANVSTTGFKRARANLRELSYESLVATQNAAGPAAITPLPSVGTGAQAWDLQRLPDQGALQETGRELDVALQGRGYFVVTLANGQPAYTRDGSFHLDDERRIVTADGNPVLAQATPPWAAHVVIDPSGAVYAVDTLGSRQELVGSLTVVTFASEEGLQRIGNNLMVATPAAGNAVLWGAANPGSGEVVQGALERSNVDVGDVMTRVMEAQRAYQLSLKALQTIDEMLGAANQLRK